LIKRNLKRFPDDFMFQIFEEEFKNLIFQNGTSSWGGRRKAPYAFTEQGVAMLSGVLSSDRAIDVNIRIIRIFKGKTNYRNRYWMFSPFVVSGDGLPLFCLPIF